MEETYFTNFDKNYNHVWHGWINGATTKYNCSLFSYYYMIFWFQQHRKPLQTEKLVSAGDNIEVVISATN